MNPLALYPAVLVRTAGCSREGTVRDNAGKAADILREIETNRIKYPEPAAVVGNDSVPQDGCKIDTGLNFVDTDRRRGIQRVT